MKKNIKLALLGTLLLMVSLPVHTQTAKRPNILFAIADDWAYGYAGAYGSRFVKTPAFDRVAREGALFTRAYTPNANRRRGRKVSRLFARQAPLFLSTTVRAPCAMARGNWSRCAATNGSFTTSRPIAQR